MLKYLLGVCIGGIKVGATIVENEIELSAFGENNANKVDMNRLYVAHTQNLFGVDGVVLSYIYFTIS